MTPRECLLSQHPSVPNECHVLRYTFFECKRSLVSISTGCLDATKILFYGRKYLNSINIYFYILRWMQGEDLGVQKHKVKSLVYTS